MPEAVALAVVDALELSGTAATVAFVATEIAVSLEITFGVGLLEQLIMGGPKQPPPPHARRENFRQTIAPRIKYYGRCNRGGTFQG